MAVEKNTTEHVAQIAEKIRAGKTSLGIEFGSTRIKAVLIDDTYATIAAGDHGWENHLENGLWTYSLDEVWSGLQAAYAALAYDVENAYGEKLTKIGTMGFSAMMHGYLAFDKDGKLLVPFRTWRNSNTHEAHEKLSELFQYNIPERWSIAHLYQCILNKEDHVPSVAFFTTLAGYVHWKLTGRKVLGVDDASGMFPIDPETHGFNKHMLEQFSALPEVAAQPWKIEDLLPTPLVAGSDAGTLTAEGAKLLDPTGTLQSGTPLAPPEGDSGTGMVATNSVRVGTGNVSAGTSIFASVVLDHPLERLHPEVDLVSTPAGDPCGMSHANNFTSDLNAWIKVFSEFAKAIGTPLDAGTLYGTLFRAAIGEDADDNAGGLINYCFYSGEFLAGLEEGRPVFARGPESRMNLANFMRAQLFGAFSPVKIGMDVMTKDEHVKVDSMVGHGGIFTTPKVAQKILAAAFDTPIKVMSTAAEGGAWGMAVLADYLWHKDTPLDVYLDERVFADVQSTTEEPDPKDVAGFEDFFARFTRALPIEKTAIETIDLES
ncbi:FGGY-family carbohydrate kinase [Bifidobacterium sp. ESL0798]|uniref:xylulokinase n=1 Tax=unclassified Bifidobacterium TaxID=2608897 RepID=UPI0023F79F0D|nr:MULTISPECIES: FGGY-family carbohydrate kinase [unclassified Bifidobacterium]WEV53323.1 FGGY-family carbohydrate kinase [Bifidobacterium sp. ESL0704]WEV73693.1 FGGY-family carbohydrate kinase [Bifidobacterium sp. ESL0798]